MSESRQSKSGKIRGGCEKINLALQLHQMSTIDWGLQKVARELHFWTEIFIEEFKLRIGTPALMIERLKSHLGHYRPGRNAFGLKDEIAIDSQHIECNAHNGSYWQVLGTLVHELLHSWQEYHGHPATRNRHNNEFRDKAQTLGLIIDARGVTEYQSGNTPFFNLLKKYGIEPPEIPSPESAPVRASRSKLRLYECQCEPPVKVRVGRARFNAKCLDCDGLFKLKGCQSSKSTNEFGAT